MTLEGNLLPLPQRVMVTGAAGRIGRAVVSHFNGLGVPVTALSLDDPGDLAVDRLVVGSASDRAVVDRALTGVDAVVHLAALSAPMMGTPEEVFARNTAATFTVLEAAGSAGVRRAAIASSVNAVGVGWSVKFSGPPAYLPLDEEVPARVADPYSLSKLVGEEIATAMSRRHGMSVVSLRFPRVGTIDDSDRSTPLAIRAEHVARDPSIGSAELWLYLEERDAASTLERAVRVAGSSAHAVFVAAESTYAPYATEDLLDRYHPEVPRRRRLPGRAAPVDLTRVRKLLRFSARHLLPGSESVLELPSDVSNMRTV